MSIKAQLKNHKKWTVSVHILLGLLCAALVPLGLWPLGIAILGLFALDEWWEDRNSGKKEGEVDWWWAFAAFLTGVGIICILFYLGKISVGGV